LAAREQYAGRGWKTVPLTEGKTPNGVKAWQTKAFSADDFNRAWAREAEKLKDKFAPGVGVQLGPASQIIDPEWDNEEQFAELVELCGGSLPNGPQFTSTRGGHALFQWDDRLAHIGATVEFPSGLKVRVGGTAGAQSAFPPSPGKAWVEGTENLPVPAAPESLIAALLANAKATKVTGDDVVWSEHQFSDDQLAACREALAAKPDAIEGQNGHDAAFHLMAEICRHIGNREQAEALALEVNQTKCLPPFDDDEILRKLDEAAKAEPPRGHAVDDFEPVAPWDVPQSGKPFPYKFYTSAQLAAADLRVEFLIDRAMVAAQPMFIAGPSKTLKTSLAIDAAIALASKGKFLDAFEVNRQCGVVVMSGESGLPVIRDTAEAQCRRRGLSLASMDQLHWSADLPEFGDKLHVEAVDAALQWFNADVLVVDPLYLALKGDEASNAQIQGRLIRTIAQVCERLGVVLVVAAHTKKLDHFQPLTLNDIAYSAAPQFAGQWWLVNRRSRFVEGSGRHGLWLSIGGRAKFSSVWEVDVTETEADDFSPPRWEVEVRDASQASSQKQSAKVDEAREKVEAFFLRNGNEAVSQSKLQKQTGIRWERLNDVLTAMLLEGEIEHADYVGQWNKVQPNGVRLAKVLRPSEAPTEGA